MSHFRFKASKKPFTNVTPTSGHTFDQSATFLLGHDVNVAFFFFKREDVQGLQINSETTYS